MDSRLRGNDVEAISCRANWSLTLDGFLFWGIGTGSPGSASTCNDVAFSISGDPTPGIVKAACTASTVLTVITGATTVHAGNLVAQLPVGANVIIEDVGAGYSIENTPESAAAITVNGSKMQPGTLDEDGDNDGYLTTRESFLGTLSLVGCAATLAVNDEDPDPNPRDNNDDRRINLTDLVRYGPVFNSPSPANPNYQARYDLTGDGRVNLSDIIQFGSAFNTMCTP